MHFSEREVTLNFFFILHNNQLIMRLNRSYSTLIFSFLLLLNFHAHADMPGKKSMADSKVTFQDLNKYTDWEFHWESEYANGNGILKTDTSVSIPGSNGKPASAYFYATNKKTGESTDSIEFSNYYAPDYVVIIKGISADSLKYTKVALTNDNADGDEDHGGLQDVKNSQLLEDARAKAYSRNTKYFLYIGLPILALIIMIQYFRKRKKKAELLK